MANEEQLAILRQGVEVWNTWRKEYPSSELDLSKADLREANLHGANLYGVDLQGAKLQDANLSKANLEWAQLQDANLSWTKLYRSDLRGAKLQGANLQGANLYEAKLYESILRGADLRGTILVGAELYRADLREGILYEAVLQRANLREAKLQWVDLREAILREAMLIGADLTHAVVGDTTFGNLDLREVRGLDLLHHVFPSTIGIDTIYRSQGDIPEVFLRGCGVPDSMIEYARSLVAAERPIDYYSVFISYSSTDEAIAQRLHADLQARGVRCWFAPHDLEIGAPIVRGIDEAIRIYDKLLIILSEAAVTSRWVEFEVNQALHHEIEQGRTLRFPIRLDDAVLHTPSGWAAQLRTRNIGDFRGWKDYDRYQEAFTRLLRDLKAKE